MHWRMQCIRGSKMIRCTNRRFTYYLLIYRVVSELSHRQQWLMWLSKKEVAAASEMLTTWRGTDGTTQKAPLRSTQLLLYRKPWPCGRTQWSVAADPASRPPRPAVQRRAERRRLLTTKWGPLSSSENLTNWKATWYETVCRRPTHKHTHTAADQFTSSRKYTDHHYSEKQ